MKTIKYNPEYFTQTVELLKQAKNAVNPSSDVFDDIARLFENTEANETALNKLFSKDYTVLAVENEIPVGIASMDKDGGIGIFAALEGETFSKACKQLSADLDRRAAKKDISMLTLFPLDGKANIFLNLKYETYDAASGEFGVADEFMLAKKIKLNDEPDLKPEQAKKLVLDPSKKIIVEGIDTVFPFVFFGTACFFIFLFTIITVTAYDPSKFRECLIIGIVVGLFFAVALGILIAYFVRCAMRKKKVLSMSVTNGMITALVEDVVRVRNDGRTRRDVGDIKCTYVNISYVFYDENGQKREAHFNHKYTRLAPFFYPGQELVIAYNERESFILRKYTLSNDVNDAQSDLAAPPRRDYGESNRTEYATEKQLSEYVPINGVKRYYVYSASFFAMLVIVFIATLIISTIAAVKSDLTFGWLWLTFWPFHLCAYILLGAPAAVFAIIPARANSKYKKLLKQPYLILCDGKIVQSS
ncbi:MAG: hypothetical protein K2G96_04195, partial [Clostridia bacterium]|nr:hypothetical protein [Clostridia bacterium]